MDSKTRREILWLTGVGFSVAFAGCLGAGPGSESNSELDPDAHVPDEWHDEPARGTAEPVEMSTSIRDEVTYHPDREMVEIDGGELRPVDEWLRIECPYVAGRHVGDLLNERLADRRNIEGRDLNRTLFEDEAVLEVKRTIELDRDGTVVSSPGVAFETVREAVPRYVVATATLDEFEHTCRLPVYVRDVLSQLD